MSLSIIARSSTSRFTERRGREYDSNCTCGREGHPFGEQTLCSITWLADDQMTSARVLSIANNEHRMADERVEGVGDRHLGSQTPGIMNSLRAWAARAPRLGAPFLGARPQCQPHQGQLALHDAQCTHQTQASTPFNLTESDD